MAIRCQDPVVGGGPVEKRYNQGFSMRSPAQFSVPSVGKLVSKSGLPERSTHW